jgi:hypothetical protein
MTMMLFRVGEASLYRFCSSSIKLFTPVAQSYFIRRFYRCLPNMPRDDFGVIFTGCALVSDRAALTFPRVGMIVSIASSTCRFID